AMVETDDGGARLPAIEPLLRLLGYDDRDFDQGDAIPEAIGLWVPEGRQLLRPTRALRTLRPPEQDAADTLTPAAEAGRAYELLIWELPLGLDPDRPETTTGEWHYPPAAKFDRLLRHARV